MFVSNKNAIARKIYNSYFLIDITDNYSGDRCALYEVNETGMFLWENLSTKKTADELAALLKEAIVDDVAYQSTLPFNTSFPLISLKPSLNFPNRCSSD